MKPPATPRLLQSPADAKHFLEWKSSVAPGGIRIADQDIRLRNDFRFILNVVRQSFGVRFHVACSSDGHHALMTVRMALKAGVGPGTQNENPT
jgi:hypothetical protein